MNCIIGNITTNSTFMACSVQVEKDIVSDVSFEYWLHGCFECILLVLYFVIQWVVCHSRCMWGKYQYFLPNWLIFPSKLGSSSDITLGIPLIFGFPEYNYCWTLPSMCLSTFSWPNCMWQNLPGLPSIFAYCKQWNTGGRNSLGIRLAQVHFKDRIST